MLSHSSLYNVCTGPDCQISYQCLYLHVQKINPLAQFYPERFSSAPVVVYPLQHASVLRVVNSAHVVLLLSMANPDDLKRGMSVETLETLYHHITRMCRLAERVKNRLEVQPRPLRQPHCRFRQCQSNKHGHKSVYRWTLLAFGENPDNGQFNVFSLSLTLRNKAFDIFPQFSTFSFLGEYCMYLMK